MSDAALTKLDEKALSRLIETNTLENAEGVQYHQGRKIYLVEQNRRSEIANLIAYQICVGKRVGQLQQTGKTIFFSLLHTFNFEYVFQRTVSTAFAVSRSL